MGARGLGSIPTFVDVVLAILLPPLGVFLGYGCQAEFWISLLFTILGYIPGIIYALYVLLKPIPDPFTQSQARSPPATYV